jgi:twitching motility protein PilJ
VVSGLNSDVQEISQQVGNFTTGVEQSQQAFNTILSVSEQVAHMGQQVTQSSQAIADAAQTTLQLIHSISHICTETFNRAGVTREQAQHMEHLARTLLQTVEFFQMHSEPHLVSEVAELSPLACTIAPVSENHSDI